MPGRKHSTRHCESVDLAAVAVELYELDPYQFTAARNERANGARAAGATAVSNQIKTLRKPTLAAWLTNLLVRTDPDSVNELTQLGDEPRTWLPPVPCPSPDPDALPRHVLPGLAVRPRALVRPQRPDRWPGCEWSW
jgi:hypothetical protein